MRKGSLWLEHRASARPGAIARFHREFTSILVYHLADFAPAFSIW